MGILIKYGQEVRFLKNIENIFKKLGRLKALIMEYMAVGANNMTFYLAHCVPLVGKGLPQILPRFFVLGLMESARNNITLYKKYFTVLVRRRHAHVSDTNEFHDEVEQTLNTHKWIKQSWK